MVAWQVALLSNGLYGEALQKNYRALSPSGSLPVPLPRIMRISWSFVSLAFTAVTRLSLVDALGHDACVNFEKGTDFALVRAGKAANILVSTADSPSVHRALLDFQNDIYSVSGTKPVIQNVTALNPQNLAQSAPVIVGTLASPLINSVIKTASLDVSSLTGKWETFVAKKVVNPLPGVSEAYVIIGSDRRG